MANVASRYGSSLLALNTSRPPDLGRGSGIVHFTLRLPAAIDAEVRLWERGQRAPLDPQEAAQLLWTVPVAAFLNGGRDAWKLVPGINLLLPGLEVLSATRVSGWPKSQTDLQTLVGGAVSPALSGAALLKELDAAGTAALLNDLVLIFKYAAIGQERPVRTAAELYRLAVTLTATSGAPTRLRDVIAWLSAPLVVDRALTTAPRSRGAYPPPRSPGGGRPSRSPDLPQIDITTVMATEAIGRLEEDLSELERLDAASDIASAIGELRATAPSAAVTRLASAIGARSDLEHPAQIRDAVAARRSALLRRWQPSPTASSGRIVRMPLGGVPVVFDLSEVLARLDRSRREAGSRLAAVLPARLRDRLSVLDVALEDLAIWPDLLVAATHSPSYLEPAGRSDLLLVRQVTTGYRRAEIAYIENILIGETRFREHTNRVLTREEVFESTEQETEETRDLQVADRAELSREVTDIVREDLRAEGSVEVTSRGPTKVVASATVSYERSTEEAAKSAEAYARETVERAVKRTLERVKREVRALFEQETLEVNRHSFIRDDTAPDHVSGVYQYLERVSRAKIFWYGERELYDLLVPEPAALIWHFAVERKELHIPLQAPDADLFASLTLENIASLREEVIRAYRVSDLPSEPPRTQVIPMPISGTGGGDGAKYATNKDLQIPEGYVVEAATFVVSAEVEGPGDFTPNGGVVIGNDVQLWEAPIAGATNTGSARVDFSFQPPLPGPAVGVAVNVDNFRSLSGNVSLALRLTDEAERAWQLAAFARVSERYEQLRREYEQALIQAAATQADEVTDLPEGSRLRLQQIVRGELQRAAIDTMRNAPVNYDLMSNTTYPAADGTNATHPTADPLALKASEPEVRFLQQAFEWEHLAWILYPYFWGRRSEWSKTVVQSHPDPDFAAFLNAGAARLQIPVRPGFEDLVKHFMETGEVYEGSGLPKMGDPGYISFIDEQLTSLGAPGEEIPWPPSAPREWDIVAPTSMVLVRPVAQPQLPTWDADTGKEV